MQQFSIHVFYFQLPTSIFQQNKFKQEVFIIKIYIAYYLDDLTDNQIEFLGEHGFEFYENEGVNKFRKEFKDIEELKEILNITTNFTLIPSYAVLDDEGTFLDFDEDNTYFRNDLITKEHGEDFLIEMLKMILTSKDIIEKRAIKIDNLIREVSDDFLINLNLWEKFGYARIYVNIGPEKAGFIDLINFQNLSNDGFEEILKTLSQDERIKEISKYYLLKNGFINN
jgi:hypothetical protein